MPIEPPTPNVGFVVSGLPPVCDDCLSHDGLCLFHGKSVLPQLAQPHWVRLIGTTGTPDKALPDETPDVLKAKRRRWRRLERAMAGEFTRSRAAQMIGRPREHDRPAIVADICERVAAGMLVKTACAKHDVTRGQLHRWCTEDADFRDAYARARVDQAHALAEEALELADNAIPGKEGNVDKVRVQVDARKWMASKLAPRLYGEKLEVSGDPERPLQVQVWQFGSKTVTF